MIRSVQSPRSNAAARRSWILLVIAGLQVLGGLAWASQANAAPHWERRSPLTPRVDCSLDRELESWSKLQQSLGVHAPEHFGNADDPSTPAHQLRGAWSMLQQVDLPGLGNAANFVAQHISSIALDARMIGGVRAEYRHSSRTLMLAPDFFESVEHGDVARAATLLHEARHAQDRRYRHVTCPTSSDMAWLAQCDLRYTADVADPEAGAWSLEVAFLAQLAAKNACVGPEQLKQRIEMRLQEVFRSVDSAEFEQLNRQTKGLLRNKKPDDLGNALLGFGRN